MEVEQRQSPIEGLSKLKTAIAEKTTSQRAGDVEIADIDADSKEAISKEGTKLLVTEQKVLKMRKPESIFVKKGR